MEGNDTARVEMRSIAIKVYEVDDEDDVKDVHVAAGGDMQIITKGLTAEEGNHMLVARLSPSENDDGLMYVAATWKNADMVNFKEADKADDVHVVKMDEG